MINEYFRPETIEEAYKLVKSGAEILGGGGFITKHQIGINAVVDLQNLGLTGIKVDEQFIKIGAAEKLQNILESDIISNSLKEAIIRFPGSLNIRNEATIAGAVLIADGRFDLLSWLFAAKAEVEIYPSNNKISLSDYLQKIKSNEPDSIITKILIPNTVDVNMEAVTRSPNDAILVGVFVSQPKSISENFHICIAGQDLYPTCFEIKKQETDKRQVLIRNLKNAHSHYTNKYCSFKYFQSITLELFDRLMGV